MLTNLIAQINLPNPEGIGNYAIKEGYGRPGDGTDALTNYIVLLWRTLIMVGALTTILFLLWGAVDWITAGGDQGKIESARKKMTGAVIGLIILASSIALVEFVGNLVGLSLLEITFPTADNL